MKDSLKHWAYFGQSLIVVLLLQGMLLAEDQNTDRAQPVHWWRFDEVVDVGLLSSPEDKAGVLSSGLPFTAAHAQTNDEFSTSSDELFGFHKLVTGVAGKALRLGGINSYLERFHDYSIPPDHPFTIESWIALAVYPLSTCPIIAQADAERGVVFGVDERGHLGLWLAIENKWVSVVSDQRIPLNEWSHVACVYRPDQTVELYLNGKLIDEQQIHGAIEAASDAHLLIGKHPTKRFPIGTMNEDTSDKVHVFLDGMLDELKIYGIALSAAEIDESYTMAKPASAPDLPTRKLPTGPGGEGAFGAFNTTLKYYDAWDEQWRVSEQADVVIRFENNPCRFIFWRGTGYIPHWVTENGIWYDNEFNETWVGRGCQEPMSDKQCRNAQVRVLETNEARAVVHWRYALINNWYQFAYVDDLTGWGDWTDEVYTVFPDGVGVREITLHSTTPHAPHEWHESIIVMNPGQVPEDVLEPGAITLVNSEGEAHTYSWQDGLPDSIAPLPQQPNAQITNTRSKYKPFVALRLDSDPKVELFQGTVRKEFSMFPWWNHWPTAFEPSDGRFAQDSSRASHCSISNWAWNPYRETSTSITKLMLVGLTERSPQELARLVRSWDSPAPLTITEGGFEAGGYDPAQRSYLINRSTADKNSALTMRFAATEQSPIVNLSLTIANWQGGDAKVSVDGKSVPFRAVLRPGLEGTDLILWIECESVQPISVTVLPKD